ncbi:zinc-binding alcohol dehydrogenase family protein [Actinoplanes sp. NPDC051851]|uniref:quinone oxidoreductase family protein n=1 Tax=Actinoplanes sp. NPDC051851 TaxID=3154753 RepID=UPI003421AA85
MKRVRYHRDGLRVEEAPEPVPGDGELLIRTRAIGVTLPALRRLTGPGTELPTLPGGEVAGEVIGSGRGVTGWAPGDRVSALPFGGAYAEVVTAAVMTAERIPDGGADAQAVALVRSGHVALGVLDAAALTGGESVLVTAAASGVGHLLVQLARLRGAGRVVAVAGPGKASFLYDLGADEVLSYTDGPWPQQCVVLDGAGGGAFTRGVEALRPGGRLVFYSSGGGTIDASALLAGSKTVTGFGIANLARGNPARYAAHGRELWELALDGRLRPVVHGEFPLDAAATAHEIVEARENCGKVVLRP